MAHSGVRDFLSGTTESEVRMNEGSLRNVPAAAGNTCNTAGSYARAKNLSDWAKDYYRIKVTPKNQFSTFRIEHLTENDSMHITGQLDDGSWGTQQWLINKKDVHLEDGKLVADNQRIQDALKYLQR